jgi:hypothetical protein
VTKKLQGPLFPSFTEEPSIQERGRRRARQSKRRAWLPHVGKRVRVKNLRAATKRVATFTDDQTVAALARMLELIKDEPDVELRGLIMTFNALQNHDETGVPFHNALTYLLDKYEAAKPGETII